MQYSKPKNLVEFIVQMSSGALQTAFGKSAAKGGSVTQTPSLRTGTSPDNRQPSQGTVILQGSYWRSERPVCLWREKKLLVWVRAILQL